MPKKNDSWGIEVGSNAIKAIRLVRSGAEVELADYEVLPFKKILTTPDLNVDEAIQMNLDQFLSKRDLRRSSVVLSVPGNMAFARFAKLPPVEPKKIPDIVRFEAVQQIPFPIEQVEWDYQVFQQEDAPDVEVGIFAISKERVAKFLSNYRQVNVKVDAVTLSPLAVYNAFHFENEGGEQADGTIYMDIGTVSTDVIIVENEGIWLRTLPIGGNNFTEALVRAFKLSFPRAEKLKREASTSKYARQIFQAMRPVFADLVQELQRSLGYYQSMNRESNIKRVVGVGSTFRLPGLQKFLKQQLQMEVVRPDGYKRLAVEGRREADFAESALNMATAYGLALQGLGLETVSANLLPSYILKSRMWRAKQPWMAAATACLVVGAGLTGVTYFTSEGGFRASLDQTQVPVRNILNQAGHFKSQWDQISQTSNPTQQIENMVGVLDYRQLTPQLIAAVSSALSSTNPQPEPTHVDSAAMSKPSPTDRRRVYVDSIQTQYKPDVAAASSPPAGQFPAAGGPAMGGAASTPALGQNTPVDVMWHDKKGPQLEVTISGMTSYRDASGDATSLLNELLAHLSQVKGRAYVFRSISANLIYLGPLTTQSSKRADSGSGSGRFRGFRGNSNAGGGASGSSGASQNNESVASLMPQNPLDAEDRSQFQSFVIRWTVELKKPGQVRSAGNVTAPPAEHVVSPVSESGPGKDGQS